MERQDLLKMLTGEYGEGRSFRVSTAWVKENDWEVYDYLHELMTEFVEDETNLTNEEDLEAFENGDWEVEYSFSGYLEDEEIEILITAGRNGQHIANQPAWIQEFIPVDELMDYWNWEKYLELVQVEYQKGGWNMKKKKYLVNAFSIQMLSGPATTVRFEEIDATDIPSDVTSAIGHADTAAVLSDLLGFPVPMNRMNVTLDENTELYVAQLVGGRLPEGATTLPEGFRFKFYRVTLV